MPYKNETVEKNVIIDFFKLNCYRKEKGISLSALSLSVGKSRNWLSHLQRKSDNLSKPPIVDLSVALLLANTLGCTIQDIKLYTPFFERKNVDKSDSDQYKELIEAYIREFTNSKEVLPEEFQGKVQLLVEKTVSFIERRKDFRTPFVVDYVTLAKKSIDQLDAVDQSIIAFYLMEMAHMDDETKKKLRFHLLCALRDKNCRNDYDIQYRSNWWVNLFLTELRKEFFDMQKRKEISIPHETELRGIFIEELKKDSCGRTTQESREAGRAAIEKRLRHVIFSFFDRIDDHKEIIQNTAKRCADYIYDYFGTDNEIRETHTNLYRDGRF